MVMKFFGICIVIFVFLMPSAEAASTDRVDTVHPLAIFHFVEKSDHLAGMGEKVSDMIFANLSVEPGIALVDRNEMNKIQDELVLNLSGMVNAKQANQIGMLTGARIIVTGTIFELEGKLILVAKLISAETSRVVGATVKGNSQDSILSLVDELSVKIVDTLNNNIDILIAETVDKQDRIAALKQKLSSVEKPSLTIRIKEHHVNRASADPAAETEMILFSTESGFEVIDYHSDSARSAEIVVTGEGFSEFATRHGELVGVKARLEVKAIDQATKRILAVDRQTVIEVDLSEIIASKKALQKASAMIAERMLPKITMANAK
jgi:TolB-like protein